MEYSYFYLDFNLNFKLEQIPDECIINMLDYINYRTACLKLILYLSLIYSA